MPTAHTPKVTRQLPSVVQRFSSSLSVRGVDTHAGNASPLLARRRLAECLSCALQASGSAADGGVPGDKPRCKYGAGCTRKNPEHFLEFSHPERWAPADKPRCKYGAACTRKNPEHLQDYGHPAR